MITESSGKTMPEEMTKQIEDFVKRIKTIIEEEAVSQRVTAEEYTQSLIEMAIQVLSRHHQDPDILLLLSSLENNLPKAWRNADPEERTHFLLVMLSVYLINRWVPDEWETLVKSLELVNQKILAETRRQQAQETVALFNKVAASLKENGESVVPLSRAELYAERGL